ALLLAIMLAGLAHDSAVLRVVASVATWQGIAADLAAIGQNASAENVASRLRYIGIVVSLVIYVVAIVAVVIGAIRLAAAHLWASLFQGSGVEHVPGPFDDTA